MQGTPVIKAKAAPVIKTGNNLSYDPKTFAEKVPENFYNLFEIDDSFIATIVPFTTALLPGRKFITFDTETTVKYESSAAVPLGKVRRWVGSGKSATPQDIPFVISICDANNCYTIWDSEENSWQNFRKLRPLFEDPSVEMIAHNWKFDAHMIHNIGMKIVGKVHDTVVMAKLANENRNSFTLLDLAHWKGGIRTFEDMLGSYKALHKVTNYKHFPPDLLGAYANADVFNCKVVFLDELKKLVADELLDLYDTEMELMIALYAMERHGMKVDAEYEKPLKEDLCKIVAESEQAVYDEVGYMFNMNSGKQLHQALVATGVDESQFHYTAKGNVKLDKKELERLEAEGVTLIEKLLVFRKNEKLLNTYAVGIYAQADSELLVHGGINQTEATTGRMSVTKPALQTLPKRDRRIRSCFVPRSSDSSLVFMDLDQVEFRIMAHYAKAEALIQSIKDGFDVHAGTAAVIFNKPIEDITEEERSKAKTMNFALVYGQGDELTAQTLRVPLHEARDFKARYFAAIPELKPFVSTVHQVTKMRGYVKNFYGRRRRLKNDEYYKAPNALIQGCAADYIKSKIVAIYKYIQTAGIYIKMLMPVHDEVVFEFNNDYLDYVPYIRWILSEFDAFRVPITAGVEFGNTSWGQKVEPEQDPGFSKPSSLDFLKYNVFDGRVFDL